MFLAQAADDPVCPVDNSLMMFAALRTARIPTEMHIFQSGGHGWGLGRPGSEVHAWPELFIRWAAQNSLLRPCGMTVERGRVRGRFCGRGR